MRRMSVYDRIGWCAVALIALMLAPDHPYAALALVLAVIAIRTGAKWAQRRSERRRLAADATVQHQALMMGADQVGVYGRYPPPTPGGTVVVPGTPWPPGKREEYMRFALEKVLEQHAEAFSKLADS